jgi:hypothetical protein
MSLLGTPVYANPSTPLWASASGGTITGNVAVDGFLSAGRVAASRQLEPAFGNFALVDASGITVGGLNQLGTPGATDTVVQTGSGRKLFFGLVGGAGANTSLTPSAVGSNTDLFSVGGTVDALALRLENTGAAPVVGKDTLALGTKTVSTTACDVGSYILITRTAVNASTALGQLRVSNQGADDFTVVSADPANPATTETGDLSDFSWMIINPA